MNTSARYVIINAKGEFLAGRSHWNMSWEGFDKARIYEKIGHANNSIGHIKKSRHTMDRLGDYYEVLKIKLIYEV